MSSEARPMYNSVLLITQLSPGPESSAVLDIALEEDWFVEQYNSLEELSPPSSDEAVPYGGSETRPYTFGTSFSALVVCTTIQPASWRELTGAALFGPNQERIPKALVCAKPTLTDRHIGQHDIILSADPFDRRRFASWLGQAAILARHAESV